MKLIKTLNDLNFIFKFNHVRINKQLSLHKKYFYHPKIALNNAFIYNQRKFN